ncbi:sulfatase-like hydrolase/transferase [Halorarius halobius]|uniref:sulfatase-like hydrolase/transferase n=1 Tax=Halorarius halobius TaxID=2962671 RepID=UPI0020CF4F27|nr:sulfatase-like hydrolase/transferase [Halorarius halobius]
MNIALVVLDTLRKDAFDDQFEWLPGRRFERAWATSNWTAPVHAALFTGRYASEVGVHSKANELDCEEPTLAEQLSAAGYTTRAFSANPNVSKRFEFHRGFEEFTGSWKIRQFNTDREVFDWSGFVNDTKGEGPTRYLTALRRCVTEDVDTLASLKQGFDLKFRPDRLGADVPDDGAQASLERIRETEYGDDEFLFLNLMEAHGPYEPPEEYRTVDHEKPSAADALLGEVDVDRDAVRQAYEDSVRYLSDVYREIFAELRAEFDYVITLSDHGELLGEHGHWDHQYGLYPELTHVPLVVWGDDLEGSTDATVSLLDVHRTVLDLADVDGDSRGRNLLSDPGRECLTEYHGLTRWLLDEFEAGDDVETVRKRYDAELAGVALPPSYYGYETEDGWTEHGTADADPRDRFETLRDSLDRRDVEPSRQELSEEALEQLEDLGYA